MFFFSDFALPWMFSAFEGQNDSVVYANLFSFYEQLRDKETRVAINVFKRGIHLFKMEVLNKTLDAGIGLILQ